MLKTGVDFKHWLFLLSPGMVSPAAVSAEAKLEFPIDADQDESRRLAPFMVPADLMSVLDAAGAGRFRTVFQPCFDVTTGRVVSCDAQLHLPSEWTPRNEANLEIANGNGLIVELGDRVLRDTCRAVRELRKHHGPDVYGTVKLATSQLFYPDLGGQIQSALSLAKLPPGALRVQVTSDAFCQHSSVLRDLRCAGVAVAVGVMRMPPTRRLLDGVPYRPDAIVLTGHAAERLARGLNSQQDYERFDQSQAAGIELVVSDIRNRRHLRSAVQIGASVVKGPLLATEGPLSGLMENLAAGRQVPRLRRSLSQRA